MLPAEVVIPLRWDQPLPEQRREVEEMAQYLERLVALADVTVVDGSRRALVEAHRAAWPPRVRLLVPQGRGGVNGKVVGALCGIEAARHELVVLADDDVRYEEKSLSALLEALGSADVVRPQNVYDEWPWQARWDFSRSLVARAVGADWPGTFGLRASAIRTMNGWSADVLFENLEMVRTAQAHGCVVANQPSLAVTRRPPTVRHFLSQRVRQAYDDFAQPGRLLAELCILPLTVLSSRRRWAPALLAATCVAVAEVGRRRFGGLDIPRDVPCWAPLWTLERGLCVWIALATGARGGVRYRGRRLRVAAHRSEQRFGKAPAG